MTISWQEALSRVSKDEGPFVKLGTSFKSAGTLWIGPVVASSKAVYFVKKYKQQYRGAIGAVLNETIARDDEIATCSLTELPPAVKAFLGRSKQLQDKHVVVIPQTTVSFVKTGTWNSIIAFTAGTHTFVANTSFITMFKRPRQLMALGWILNKPLVPEAPSLHDEHIDGSRVTEMPSWKKVAYVTLAIFLLIAIIFLAAALKNQLR
jgi:hypothetical protein